eukprot:TRINITY_DN3228_c0_g3_i1.p1 TRINITY_DN3228_c0_g3~~TRINITY_DN3228_c0_g3_i1.p1  ORF type:complete len:258 (+),score=47.86 TRINITY_DN3228_c0_g3_i1:33-776(+)
MGCGAGKADYPYYGVECSSSKPTTKSTREDSRDSTKKKRRKKKFGKDKLKKENKKEANQKRNAKKVQIRVKLGVGFNHDENLESYLDVETIHKIEEWLLDTENYIESPSKCASNTTTQLQNCLTPTSKADVPLKRVSFREFTSMMSGPPTPKLGSASSNGTVGVDGNEMRSSSTASSFTAPTQMKQQGTVGVDGNEMRSSSTASSFTAPTQMKQQGTVGVDGNEMRSSSTPSSRHSAELKSTVILAH